MKKLLITMFAIMFGCGFAVCEIVSRDTTWNLKLKTTANLTEEMLAAGINLCNMTGIGGNEIGNTYKLYPNAKKTKWKTAKNPNVSIKYDMKTGKMNVVYKKMQDGILEMSQINRLYIVVDVSGGPTATSYPITYHTNLTIESTNELYKTDQIVLRQIPAGTFIMGSPTNETGRDTNETQHIVTISKPFYIGIYEITQTQWSNVMGNNPANHIGATRPVDSVPYHDIRGNTIGANWPANNSVNSASFMGKLRTKTGLVFDLPTEAQWEYACRAETTTALNNGKNTDMNEIGRYYSNGGNKFYHTIVGSYAANRWGLYDMLGNVNEWCLDWGNESDYAETNITDPKGMLSGTRRIGRGGGHQSSASSCRSASRVIGNPEGTYRDTGFRITCPE